MSKEQTLSRMSLRQDQVLEFKMDRLPKPPDNMMKLPGVSPWWQQMELSRERDTQAIYRLVNNLSGSQAASATSSGDETNLISSGVFAVFRQQLPLTTYGDILSRNASTNVRIGIGLEGQVLTAHGSGALPTWETPTAVGTPGTGTVTSVAMTVPAFLSISGSPITTTGTLSLALSGTPLPIANGGTGEITALAAFNALSPLTTIGDLLSNDGSNDVRIGAGTSGYVLTSNGAGVLPSWQAASGGTHNLLSATHTDTTAASVLRGDIITGQAASPLWKRLALGSSGKILRSNGTDILYSTFTIPDTYLQGDVIYASADNVFSALLKDNSATRYLSNTGTDNNPLWAQVDLSNGVSGILTVYSGGTGTGSEFTIGSVVFAGASGIYEEDNANFFWDNTNNRLGIGTVSPSVSLDVLGVASRATSPAQITADQNDYAIGSGTFFRLSTDASRTITGMTGGSDGKWMAIANVGSFSLVLANQSASSAAANRIITGTGASITIAPDEQVRIIYDATTQRWRCGPKAFSSIGSHNLLSATHSDTVSQSPANGGLIYGNSSLQWDVFPLSVTNGEVIFSDGFDLFWGKVDLGSAMVTGTLSISLGGTGQITASAAFNALSPMTTTGDIIYGGASGAGTRLAGVATGNALISGGVGVAPSWGKIALTTHVSGTLPVANGGTGATTFTANRVLLGNGTTDITTSANLTFTSGTTLNVSTLAVTGSTLTTTSFLDLTFGSAQYCRFISGSSTFFQVFGPTHASLPGNLYFDYGYAASPASTANFRNLKDSATVLFLSVNSRVGVRNTNPTALLQIGAGTTGSNTAPLKFTSGPLNTSAEAGAFEFLTDSIYFTITTGSARKEITLNDITLTSGRVPFITTNARLTDSSTWTYSVTAGMVVSQTAAASGSNSLLVMTAVNHTNQTTLTETIDVNFNLARILQHATGAITTQRAFVIQAPTYSFVGASVITNAATLAITAAPTAGTNATITNNHALWVQAGNVLLGTASTGTSILRFAHASSANLTGIQAGNATSAVTYTLPTADGTSGYVLSTNGSGTLSWIASSAAVDQLQIALLSQVFG